MLAKLELLIPMLGAEISQRSVEEGMRKTGPHDENWTQEAESRFPAKFGRVWPRSGQI